MSDLEVVKSVSLSLNREGGQKEVTNGGSDQWAQLTSGVMSGLTMAQLNNLLGTYIKTVREMEDKVDHYYYVSISVAVDSDKPWMTYIGIQLS